MRSADIKLGYTCNNNCIHCVIASNRRWCKQKGLPVDSSTDEYKKKMNDSARSGCSMIVITGGEPTIRKDIFEIVRHAKNLGYMIFMQTNGRMFCYEDFCKRMVSISKIGYNIALHGHNAELHDSITRAKNSFNQTVKGIKNLRNLNQEVYIKTVISKKNFRHLKDIVMLLPGLDVRNINIAFPHAQGNAWTNFDDVVPRYSDILGYVYETIEFCKKNDITLDFEAMPFCLMKGYEDHVSEARTIREKNSQLKQLNEKTIDWDKRRKQIKQKFEACNSCRYDAICEGVWKEYPQKYGSCEFKPRTD